MFSLVWGFEAVLRDKVVRCFGEGFPVGGDGEICVVRGDGVKDFFFKVFSILEFVSYFFNIFKRSVFYGWAKILCKSLKIKV